MSNDSFTFQGTQSADDIAIVFDGRSATLTGLSSEIQLSNLDASDQLLVRGLGGDDTISVVTGAPSDAVLTIDGGAGNDTITGSGGADTLLGGSGDDLMRGGGGSDTALLGSGNDTFVWNPGDGSDVVEGQGGSDTLQFNGSNAGESISISARSTSIWAPSPEFPTSSPTWCPSLAVMAMTP
jgi:Ca2+-binding RTX toxin-like protein